MEESRHTVEGTIERVIFNDEDSGLKILSVRPEETGSSLLVSGRAAYAYPGQFLHAELKAPAPTDHLGVYQASKVSVEAPVSGHALEKFLKASPIKKISRDIAGDLAEAYPVPSEFFSDLDHNPENLLKVHGIGPKRQARILHYWEEFKCLCDLETFLFQHDLPLSWSRILRRRDQGLRELLQSPYQTIKDHGFSFDLIDGFALRQGAKPDSLDRISASLHGALQDAYRRGHCAYPENQLVSQASAKTQAPIDLVEKALELELLSEALISDQIEGVECIYLAGVWRKEREVYERLLSFRNQEPPWGWFNLSKVLAWAQTIHKIRLAPLQIQAIETALSTSLTVITGGPGTGKTTLIRSLVTILQTQNLRFALCSPTGRAAQRLQETTGLPALTVHRLLKYNGAADRFTFNRENPLPVDLVLIDEVSMVDLHLMSQLLEALPRGAALILVGDSDQIPSVGAGNVLRSIIDSGKFNTVRLTDIFRQSEKSLIKYNAQRINAGQMPLMTPNPETDFHYIAVPSAMAARAKLHQLITHLLAKDDGIRDAGQLRELQILVPTNSGALGTQRLNEELQKALNPSPSGEAIGVFHAGDKVMITQNNYTKDVYNGDIGFIRRIDHEDQTLTVDFARGREVVFDFDELDQLTLAYAISIHKSQGSEYRAVIIIIAKDHLPLAQRQLIYTAITRGKEQVFLVAEPEALQTAIESDETSHRWQGLTELLRGDHKMGFAS